MGAVKRFYHDEIELYPAMADVASHCEWCGHEFGPGDDRVELRDRSVVCSDECADDLRRSNEGLSLRRQCHFLD